MGCMQSKQRGPIADEVPPRRRKHGHDQTETRSNAADDGTVTSGHHTPKPDLSQAIRAQRQERDSQHTGHRNTRSNRQETRQSGNARRGESSRQGAEMGDAIELQGMGRRRPRRSSVDSTRVNVEPDYDEQGNTVSIPGETASGERTTQYLPQKEDRNRRAEPSSGAQSSGRSRRRQG